MDRIPFRKIESRLVRNAKGDVLESVYRDVAREVEEVGKGLAYVQAYVGGVVTDRMLLDTEAGMDVVTRRFVQAAKLHSYL